MPLFAFVALVIHFVMRLSKSFMRIDCVSCRFPFLGFIKTSSNGTSVITFFLSLFHMFGSIQTLSKSSHVAGVDPIRTVLLLRLYHVHGCRILVRLIAFDVLQRVPRSLFIHLPCVFRYFCVFVEAVLSFVSLALKASNVSLPSSPYFPSLASYITDGSSTSTVCHAPGGNTQP